MPNHHDPRLHFAGWPDRPDGSEPSVRSDEASGADDDQTIRLDEPPAPDEVTFRLTGAVPADPGDDEPTRATMLDPDSWSSEAPFAGAPFAGATAALDPTVARAPDLGTAHPTSPPTTHPTGETSAEHTPGLRRFGPGVPGQDTSLATPQAAAVWHGAVRPGDPVEPPGPPKRRRRALGGWLLPLVVLLAVLAYLAWQRLGSPVRIEGASVHSATAVQGCHSTARIVGTLRTSGGPGTVHYRWRRSDGTVSDELTQHVTKGHHSTDVVLLWTFDGPGSLTATATLDILGPQPRSASTTFRYRCSS